MTRAQSFEPRVEKPRVRSLFRPLRPFLMLSVPRSSLALAVTLLVTALFALPAAAQYPLRDGSLTLAGAAGETGAVEPGASVSLSGGGFEPGARVEIWMHSEPVLLQATRASASGAIDEAVTIPADAPAGNHRLEARGAAPGGGTTVLSAAVVVTGEPGTSSGAGEDARATAPGGGDGDAQPTAPGGTGEGVDADGALPFTGMPLALLAVVGTGLLLLGLVVGRLSGARRSD